MAGRRSSGTLNGFSNGNNGSGNSKASLKATASGRGGAGADAVYSRVTVARGDKHYLDAKQMFGIRHFAGNVSTIPNAFWWLFCLCLTNGNIVDSTVQSAVPLLAPLTLSFQ